MGNLVERNRRSGIEVELSGRVIVADNVLLDNGETGIWVLESNDVEVWNNAAYGNERQVWIEDGPRTGDTSDPAVAWNLDRVTVHNNALGRSSSDKALLAVDDWTEIRSAQDMEVVSNANAYWLLHPQRPEPSSAGSIGPSRRVSAPHSVNTARRTTPTPTVS